MTHQSPTISGGAGAVVVTTGPVGGRGDENGYTINLPAVFAQIRAGEALTAGALKDFLEHVPDHATIRDENSAVVLFLQADWEVTAR